MFGFKISPLKQFGKQTSVDPGFLTSNINPLYSDSESDSKNTLGSSKRSSSESILVDLKSNTNPFDDDEGREDVPSSSYSFGSLRKKYSNEFRDSGGFENQSVQELEDYAVYKAEETTIAFGNCLKIAVDIREDATKTLVTLHHQGDQIMRTHTNAADIERDLSRGEKLLGSLGGMFSKTWKPMRTHSITGPAISRDDPIRSGANHLEQKGLLSSSNGQSRPDQNSNRLQTVEVEKKKQDDALNDVSNILEELKAMAIDMGSEIERQNKSLDHFNDDVEELNVRVKHTNVRARRLLGK